MNGDKPPANDKARRWHFYDETARVRGRPLILAATATRGRAQDVILNRRRNEYTRTQVFTGGNAQRELAREFFVYGFCVYI